MGHSVKTVAFREFWVTARRPGYLIGTFGMPLFIGLYLLVIMIPNYMVAKKEEARRVAGFVDEAGIVDPSDLGTASRLPREAMEAAGGAAQDDSEKAPLSVRVTPYASREEALAALNARHIFTYFVVPPNYLETGEVLAFARESSLMDKGRWKESYLRRVLLDALVRERLDAALAERVKNPVRLVELTLDAEGGARAKTLQEELLKFGLPYGFGVLLMMSILVGAGFLLQGVAEEKENRIMEVILSSVTPQAFFAGKLLGLGAAAFLQLAVWILMVAVPAGIFIREYGLAIPASLMFAALLYFVAAFFMMASLILGSGALGTNLKEAQQLSMVWSMTMVPGLLFLMVIVDEPAGTTARVLSYIPFTSPIIMVAREALHAAPWWEHVLALTALGVSTWLAVKFSAKLFRIGLLLYGKRPTMKEVWRYLQEA